MESLAVSRQEAERLLSERVEIGTKLLNEYKVPLSATDMLLKYRKFNSFNVTLLQKIFGSKIIANSYSLTVPDARKGSTFDSYIESIRARISKIESIKEQLVLYNDSIEQTIEPTRNYIKNRSIQNDKVFIVHGHDKLALREIERFVRIIGLNPIILNEQVNAGKTLIEKLEAYSDVGFAIIILSPDDEGKAKVDKNLRPRARQNVIAELGYFVAKIGRERVCPLYIEGVEIPSDFSGVVYVPMDKGGSWKQKLFKELHEAGFNIDTNTVLNW
ncbi:MAG: nucleotide-binding protein [Negativicutes bacterium]|nr:nucleotide-binding protein [Negativicutes bacterium]